MSLLEIKPVPDEDIYKNATGAFTVVVTCSYYNTGNYATTIEDRTTDDKQINYKMDPG